MQGLTRFLGPSLISLDGHPVPEQLTVAVGQRVAFMNHDRTTYTIAEERQPSRPDCPERSIGVLAAGDSVHREAFTTAKTCEFHVASGVSAMLTGQMSIVCLTCILSNAVFVT